MRMVFSELHVRISPFCGAAGGPAHAEKISPRTFGHGIRWKELWGGERNVQAARTAPWRVRRIPGRTCYPPRKICGKGRRHEEGNSVYFFLLFWEHSFAGPLTGRFSRT